MASDLNYRQTQCRFMALSNEKGQASLRTDAEETYAILSFLLSFHS